jgi:O-antigen/teichoic acid export membrane protein
MNTLTRALRNSGIMFGAQGVTWIASLALTAALGRHLGEAGFGQLYLAMSFAAIFSILVEFGLDRQLVRAVARDLDRASAFLVNSLAIKVVTFAVAYLLILGLIALLGYAPATAQAIAVYNLVLLAGGVSATFGSLFLAAERMLHASIASVLEKIIVAVGAIVLLNLGVGVLGIALITIAASVVGIAWKVIFLRRWLQIVWRLDWQLIRELLSGALPFFLYAVLGSVYFRIDVLLLAKITDTTVVGWYGAAYRLFDTLVFLPNIIASAIMLPILSRLSDQSRDHLRLALGKGLDTILLLGLPIAGGLLLLARPIIATIYGRPEFLNAVPALRWLAVALLLLYVNTVLGTLLISLNQERRIVGVSAAAIILNFGLNIWLIPHYRHVAAAATTTATEALLLVCLLALVPRDLFSRSSLVVLAKGSMATAVMCLVLVALFGQSLPMQVIVGAAVYVLACLTLRVIPMEDLRLVRIAIQARRLRGLAEADGASV